MVLITDYLTVLVLERTVTQILSIGLLGHILIIATTSTEESTTSAYTIVPSPPLKSLNFSPSAVYPLQTSKLPLFPPISPPFQSQALKSISPGTLPLTLWE